MARNEEKANTMLSRFLQAKREENSKPKQKRPFLASSCRDLSDADKWRQQILREIGKKVLEIQNPGLGEHRIRDLNDEINKLIREKGHWEYRIVQLGGPHYGKMGPKIIGDDGFEVQASGRGLGYKYFGAAKQLPGVKELFEVPAETKKKRNRHELYRRIDADYYGYRDEEDGVLETLEAPAEKAARQKAVREWKKIQILKEEARRSVMTDKEANKTLTSVVDDIFRDEEEEEVDEGDDGGVGGSGQFVAHVPLPDEKEIERMVMEKKKAELLKKYTSESLVLEEVEAKQLLNIRR